MYKLESLRQEINKMLVSGNYDSDELIKKSQELDEYIVQIMKEKLKFNNKCLK